jgi:hypothetical protein
MGAVSYQLAEDTNLMVFALKAEKKSEGYLPPIHERRQEAASANNTPAVKLSGRQLNK